MDDAKRKHSLSAPEMPEMDVGMPGQVRFAYSPDSVTAHHAAWEAYAAQLEAERDALRVSNERLREIAIVMLPVMEAMRPLVLNLERLKDAASEGERREV